MRNRKGLDPPRSARRVSTREMPSARSSGRLAAAMVMTRSEQMSRIGPKDTAPELLLRSELWRRGYRYRLHHRVLGCRPDLVFVGARVVVFVDGCFWHGCPDDYSRPGTRQEFWAEKLRTNVARDSRQTLVLEEAGWRVIRVWEHQVDDSPVEVADLIARCLDGVAPAATGPDWRVVSVDVVDADKRIERRNLVALRDQAETTFSVGPRVVTRPRKRRRKKKR